MNLWIKLSCLLYIESEEESMRMLKELRDKNKHLQTTPEIKAECLLTSNPFVRQQLNRPPQCIELLRPTSGIQRSPPKVPLIIRPRKFQQEIPQQQLSANKQRQQQSIYFAQQFTPFQLKQQALRRRHYQQQNEIHCYNVQQHYRQQKSQKLLQKQLKQQESFEQQTQTQSILELETILPTKILSTTQNELSEAERTILDVDLNAESSSNSNFDLDVKPKISSIIKTSQKNLHSSAEEEPIHDSLSAKSSITDFDVKLENEEDSEFHSPNSVNSSMPYNKKTFNTTLENISSPSTSKLYKPKKDWKRICPICQVTSTTQWRRYKATNEMLCKFVVLTIFNIPNKNFLNFFCFFFVKI